VAARRYWHENYPAQGVTVPQRHPQSKQWTPTVPACMRSKRSSDSAACDPGQREPSDVCGHQRGDCKRGCFGPKLPLSKCRIATRLATSLTSLDERRGRVSLRKSPLKALLVFVTRAYNLSLLGHTPTIRAIPDKVFDGDWELPASLHFERKPLPLDLLAAGAERFLTAYRKPTPMVGCFSARGGPRNSLFN
jgi:hypothetical protein